MMFIILNTLCSAIMFIKLWKIEAKSEKAQSFKKWVCITWAGYWAVGCLINALTGSPVVVISNPTIAKLIIASLIASVLIVFLLRFIYVTIKGVITDIDKRQGVVLAQSTCKQD